MRAVTLAGTALAVLAGLLTVGGASGQEAGPSIDRTAAFIAGTQQPDGGFGGFGDGQSFDAILALRAAGIDPATVTNGGVSPAAFLAARAEAQESAAAAAKAALAAAALGLDPTDVGGTDLIAAVISSYDGGTGLYGADAFSQGLAMLGLSCTGNTVPAAAVEALRGLQLEDGGWGFQGASDPDTAAIALQALLAAGVPGSDASVAAAIAYFKAGQASDGGWGFSATESERLVDRVRNPALIAAGEPVGGPAYTKGGVTPLAYLLSQQLGDGSFAGFDPAFAANQVLPAIAGRTFCNAPSTPITRTAPATATATPSPATPPAGTPSPAPPRPPATGTGSKTPTGESAPLAVAAGLFAIAVLAAVAARARR